MKTFFEQIYQIVTHGGIAQTLFIITGAYAATLYPARRANKITTREALAYE